MLIKIDNDECIPQSSEPVASRLAKNYKCLYAYVGGNTVIPSGWIKDAAQMIEARIRSNT